MTTSKGFPEIPVSVLLPGDIDPIKVGKDGHSFYIDSKNSKGHTGQRCLKIAIDRYFGGDPLNGSYCAEIYQQAAIQKDAENDGVKCRGTERRGVLYRASFWYRGRGTGKKDSVRLIVRANDAEGNKIISGTSANTVKDSWEKISLEFETAENTSSVEVAVQFADCGVLEVDDVSLISLENNDELLINGGFEEGWNGWCESKADEQVGSIWVTNSAFIPWGLNYDRSIYHGEDYIMEEMMELSPEKVDKDFRIARQCGANVIRVFLQTSRFEPEYKRMDTVHLEYFDLLLNLAKKHNLRVDVTGLSHIDEANIPAWFYDSDEHMVDGEAYFWQQMARRYAGENIIFFFNLQNEPFIASGDTDAVVFGSFTMSGDRKFSYCHNHFLRISSIWADWVKSKYKDEEALQKAWEDFASGTESIDAPRLPKDIDNACAARSLDFQCLRLSLAEQWVSELSNAIRAEDPDRLITIGFIPEFHLTAFVPERLSPYLDFICLHIYPQHKARYTDSVTENLAFSEIWLSLAQVGKPVVIEEWFALGEINLKPREWLDIFLKHTLPYASGWISFYHILLEDAEPNPINNAIQSDWVDRFIALSSGMHSKALKPVSFEASKLVDMASFFTDNETLYELLKLFVEVKENGRQVPKPISDNNRIDESMLKDWSWRKHTK